MKTIQIQVDDTNFNSFLTILNNLKDGLVKNLVVQSDITNTAIDTVSDEEQKYYDDLLNNMSEDEKQISSKETVQI